MSMTPIILFITYFIYLFLFHSKANASSLSFHLCLSKSYVAVLVEVILTNTINLLQLTLSSQLEAEQTAANLGVQEYDALLLHGDMEQADRNKVITAFKRNENNILVATDVAGTCAVLRF